MAQIIPAPQSFAIIKSVQRGQRNVSSTAVTNQTVTAVDMSKSVLIVNLQSYSGSTTINQVLIGAELTSSTNIQFQKAVSGGSLINWQLIEYV